MKLVVWLHAALLLFAVGCAQLGLQGPQTQPQRIAAGYLTVQTFAETADQALLTGQITKTDAKNLVAGSRVAIEGLDVASMAFAKDCPTAAPACTSAAADAKLNATLAALGALQAYLVGQQAAHAPAAAASGSK